jgi:malate synthase
VLERDATMVMKDLEDDLISDWTATNIYHVVYDLETFTVDVAATEQARQAERENRKQRGVPYDKFVKKWVTDAPPADLPFFGSWSDPTVLFAGGYAGQPHVTMPADAIEPIMLPHPREVKIAQLEAEIESLKAQVGFP